MNHIKAICEKNAGFLYITAGVRTLITVISGMNEYYVTITSIYQPTNAHIISHKTLLKQWLGVRRTPSHCSTTHSHTT